MVRISLEQATLTDDQERELEAMRLRCVRRILAATTLAGSGHPGGSLSSLHMLLLLYATLNHRPDEPEWPDRDRLLVSMGHISPGVYSVLCEYGYIREDDLLLEFRRAGSAYAGHVEDCVRGVEWNTGNLGQGLSSGAGLAAGLRLRKSPARVAVLMGDGEQQKGQISEARRFAAKFGLTNLLGLVDRNRLQIGGDTEKIMPQRIREDYAAARWNVLSVEDGHHFGELFEAFQRALLGEVEDPRKPSVIIARTVMGKGVSFMEGNAKYHGSPLSEAEAARAFAELGMENPIPDLKTRRKALSGFCTHFCPATPYPAITAGEPRTYDAATLTDCRSAYGAALEDLAKANNLGDIPKVLGFSCDLEGSVKMGGFRKVREDAFFECGIQEHSTASISGAASTEEFSCFFSTFGVFAVSEVYNQLRLNDINRTHLKVVATHLGLDVGEDGQTHQCIDYIGLLENLFGFSIFLPGDPNQTDRIVRHAAANPGNIFVGMGRSKVPVVLDDAGKPFFAGDYRFTPGKADLVRTGDDGAILSCGAILPGALAAREKLLAEHGLRFSVLNFASIRPFDAEAVLRAAATGVIVTAEDHHVETGLGAKVARVLADAGVACGFRRMGVTRYGCSGAPADLYRMEGLDAEGICGAALRARQARR